MRSRLARTLATVGAIAAFSPAIAAADVQLSLELARQYQLPGTFDLEGAQVQLGANDTTVLSNTIGTMAPDASCGIVVADDSGARLIDYKFLGAPTQCIGTLPHPVNGGVFVRGSDPTAVDGEVTGFTSFIDATDQEAWAVTDETLVAAVAPPQGTGVFTGEYVTPHPVMAYSPQLDKLLGFTIGALNLGMEQRFLSQAHVINADAGTLKISGQTFGLSGVGAVGGATTRSGDGNFLIYYYSTGDEGAFFYSYNGREAIDFFKPRGEDWDDRFVTRMIYERDLIHLLWTPSNSTDTETRVTAVTDSSAELWSSTFESSYRFADGTPVELGRPRTMWVSQDHTAVLHLTPEALYLRVVDINGQSFGVTRLDDASEFPAVAIVNTSAGGLKLLTYDGSARELYEHFITFEDIEDFDPDAGIPDAGPDVGLPADVGVRDVLEAAGCCATVHAERRSSMALLLGVLATLFARRRRTLSESAR